MAGIFELAMESMGLEPRSQQSKLVDLIRQTFSDGGVKFAQAGTGTGKSFVILPTALEAARRTGHPSIVVCPNNRLIDQYVNKDRPKVQAAVGGKFVYIKGRSNYLCVNSKGMQGQGSERAARDLYLELTVDGKVEWADHGFDGTYGCPGSNDCDAATSWVKHTECPIHTGHRSWCEDVDGSKPWECPCKGPEPQCSCIYYCGAIEAKRMAESADVIITNAHVLTYNYLVGEWTGGGVSLLPTPGAVFVDECHELEAIARSCQSDEIKPNSRVYDVIPGLRDWVDLQVQKMLRNDTTEGLLGRDAEIKLMAEQAQQLAEELEDRADEAGQDIDLAKSYRKESKQLWRFVDFVAESDEHISIIELQPTQSFEDPIAHLRRVCVDTSYAYRQILTEQPSILVSGTIPGSDPRRLGVGDFQRIDDVGHPFDYSKSRLVISNHNPKMRDTLYSRSTQVAKAINASKGGALLLFTSWADMDQAMPMIVQQLDPAVRNEIYVQDREDKAALKQDIEDFTTHGSAVLAGVASLWTGLDIPGNALRTVIVWKMPYGVPTLEAKAIQRKHGQETYWDAMLCRLTQGIGRLVRTVDDKGLVFIADARAKGQRWHANSMTKHLGEFSS